MIVLKRGREKSVNRRHPWIFSGAIERVDADPKSGETVQVRSADGKPLALAAWSPQSQIRARVWSFQPASQIDAGFFRNRIDRALADRYVAFARTGPAAIEDPGARLELRCGQPD